MSNEEFNDLMKEAIKKDFENDFIVYTYFDLLDDDGKKAIELIHRYNLEMPPVKLTHPIREREDDMLNYLMTVKTWIRERFYRYKDEGNREKM